MTTAPQGYVHISVRNAQRRAAMAEHYRAHGGTYAGMPGGRALHSVPEPTPQQGESAASAAPQTSPMPVLAPNGIPGPQAVAQEKVLEELRRTYGLAVFE